MEDQEEEKKNAKHFEEMKNARDKAQSNKTVLDTQDKKVARGKERY